MGNEKPGHFRKGLEAGNNAVAVSSYWFIKGL